MKNADDRCDNRLVIDENGYAKILVNSKDDNLYPVRHESWNAGNNYVGKYSKLWTLEEDYISSLQGWLAYLKTGRKQIMESVYESGDEAELLKEIQKYY